MNNDDSKLMLFMIDYFFHDPKRIQHFIKVYTFASLIGNNENIDSDNLHILRTAAILHDIGIKNSELKYNSSAGKYQEIEGPPEAKKALINLGYDNEIIEQVCWLIANHHTYTNVTSTNLQILIEADFLVNAFEDSMSDTSIAAVNKKIFKTKTGKTILQNMFDTGTKELEKMKFPSLSDLKKTMKFSVNSNCVGCNTCIDVCPNQCIIGKRTPVYIVQESCLHCGACYDICEHNAISKL